MKTIDLLVEMQQQQTANHTDLTKTVSEGFAGIEKTMSAHALDDVSRFASLDKRLTPVEGMRTTLRWAIGVLFLAMLTGVADFFVNHVTK